ncbi:recombinase family protein [Kutzneria sp. 744]|uniref:recombinase family protein n=1 Tax=Kutzneria sp. (strain 744) TaxID=345341 RepID=UPI0003EEAA16|nr:recombinase family protein [Kutzneria sp. 744]EWM12008.1 recombinase [Kutzneria sp. 744]
MTTNTNQDDVARWAATAGRRSLAQRVAAHGARLFCSSKRRSANDASGPTTDSSAVPWAVRQRVLREYHDATLAQARRGSEELVRAGFNTGRVPYGYRPRRVRVSPSGRRLRWRTRLMIEPGEAIAVKLIFRWRAEAGLNTAAIRRRLIDASCPAPRDPETGLEGVWTQAAVRAVLRNPKYTGRQVWGRRHHGRRVPRAQWVWSDTWVHPPLITVAEFTAANHHQWRADTPPTDNGTMPSAELPDRRAA